MQEKFSSNLEWNQITLEQIRTLLEAKEVVRATGYAKTRLLGLQKHLRDIEQVIDQKEYHDIARADWVKEQQSLATEIAELERITYLVN